MVLWLAVVLKALVELSLLFIAGRFVLGLLTADKKRANVFYQMLDVAAQPALWLTRKISPRVILDRHIPLAAASWLLILWVVVTSIKIEECQRLGGAATCQ